MIPSGNHIGWKNHGGVGYRVYKQHINLVGLLTNVTELQGVL
jgi:hypothetical protein